MSALLELATYLAAAPNSVGTLGTDLFAGYMPDAPDGSTSVYVAVIPTGGVASVKAMRPTVATPPVAERPGFQVLARGGPDDFDATDARAHLAHAKLDGLGRTTMGSTVWKWVEATQQPYLIQRDENRRPWVGFNVLAVKDRGA